LTDRTEEETKSPERREGNEREAYTKTEEGGKGKNILPKSCVFRFCVHEDVRKSWID